LKQWLNKWAYKNMWKMSSSQLKLHWTRHYIFPKQMSIVTKNNHGLGNYMFFSMRLYFISIHNSNVIFIVSVFLSLCKTIECFRRLCHYILRKCFLSKTNQSHYFDHVFSFYRLTSFFPFFLDIKRHEGIGIAINLCSNWYRLTFCLFC
jgi:hypothetical protein